MCAFWKNLFGTAKNTQALEDPMKKFLLVGLGNIGSDYAGTRHNIGFEVVNAFAKAYDTTFEAVKFGVLTRTKIKGKTVILLMPNTYMNLSGKAVRYWLQQEKIPLDNLLIITDDLNIEFGTLRLKTKGSDGGHNGLKSIQALLNTSKYNRFRFGIGNNYRKGQQIDYVLGKWSAEEESALPERLEKSCELLTAFVTSGVTNTMNNFNGT